VLFRAIGRSVAVPTLAVCTRISVAAKINRPSRPHARRQPTFLIRLDVGRLSGSLCASPREIARASVLSSTLRFSGYEYILQPQVGILQAAALCN
jgi:hypothetical protein